MHLGRIIIYILSLVVLQWLVNTQANTQEVSLPEQEEDIVQMSDKWISITEAARLKGVGRASIYAAITDGKIHATELAGRALVQRADVDAYVPRAYQGRRQNTRPAGVRGPGGRPRKGVGE